MEAPVQWDMKLEIQKLIDMIPWLQRGNLEEISLRPNRPVMVRFRTVKEASDGKPVTFRLVKRGEELFLVSNELEVNARIQKFNYESTPDALMGYLLDRRAGERVSADNINGAIHKSTNTPINEVFRKMTYWKPFRQHFLRVCTKHTMQLLGQVTMSPTEAEALLKAFGVKWKNPE